MVKLDPDPSTTYALLVGIEKYAAGSAWDLNGPANDVYKFAKWLRDNKVPTENISILLSPLDKNNEISENIASLIGREPLAATAENVNRSLDKDLASRQSNLFFFFWAGHGMIATTKDDRRLFYADATSNQAQNLNFTALLDAMQTDFYKSTPRQIFFIDTCANYLPPLANIPPSYSPAASPQILHSQQFALFAANPGELAMNKNDEQTGLFSRELLTILNNLPKDGSWPPDMKTVTERIEKQFIELRKQKDTNQIPVFWWSDWVGNEKITGQSDATLAAKDRTIDTTDPLFKEFLEAIKDCEGIFDNIDQFKAEIDRKIRLRIDFKGKSTNIAFSIANQFRGFPDDYDNLLKAVREVEGNASYEKLQGVVIKLKMRQLKDSWV